jgi:hypothetical protein
MADDRSDPDREPAPGETARMPPVEPDQPGDDDATTVLGQPRDGLDATRAVEPERPDDDATTVLGQPRDGLDATRVDAGADPASRWSARAGVPPAGGAARPPGRPAWEEESQEEDPFGGRSWFRPALVAMVALVLATALGIGVWLIYQATSKKVTGPTETASPTLSAPAPTSAAPTSAAPSATPTGPPTPATVQVPANLKGQSLQVATATLTGLGLQVDIQRRPAPGVAPGTVIDTFPAGTSVVPVGSTVTLFVASEIPSPPAPSRPASPPATPPPG